MYILKPVSFLFVLLAPLCRYSYLCGTCPYPYHSTACLRS